MSPILSKILITVGILVAVVAITLLVSYLVTRSKKLDSKEKFIHSLLPELDCGKCGHKDCEAFSKAVAAETADITECKFIAKGNLSKAKRVIKKGYYNTNNLVACVRCKGGVDCKDKFAYAGQNFCWCKDSLHSGNKECDMGCLGCGDCVKVCRYGALFINKKGVAEVDREKCTGCGACTYACPNNLIVRQPMKQSVAVICKNNIDKMACPSKCKVGCTGCAMCAKICPVGAITLDNGLPVIDPDKCIGCNKCVGACPNNVISRL